MSRQAWGLVFRPPEIGADSGHASPGAGPPCQGRRTFGTRRIGLTGRRRSDMVRSAGKRQMAPVMSACLCIAASTSINRTLESLQMQCWQANLYVSLSRLTVLQRGRAIC